MLLKPKDTYLKKFAVCIREDVIRKKETIQVFQAEGIQCRELVTMGIEELRNSMANGWQQSSPEINTSGKLSSPSKRGATKGGPQKERWETLASLFHPLKSPGCLPLAKCSWKNSRSSTDFQKKKKNLIFAICRCQWCKYSQLANLRWLAQSLGARLGREAQLHTIIMFPPYRYNTINNLTRRNSQNKVVKSLGNYNFEGYVWLLLLSLLNCKVW